MPKIKITQGVIRINGAHISSKSDNAILIEADCRQKYPSILCVSSREVLIGIGPETIKITNRELPPTRIAIEDVDDSFDVILVEAGRYSVQIALLKRNNYCTEDCCAYYDE
jgi:hypothetical protein